MTIRDRTYTADEFWDFVIQPENADRFFELIEGEIVELTPSSAVPTIIGIELARCISTHVRDNKIKGYVAGADSGFRLSPNIVLSPDVAYISKERQVTLPDHYFTAAPDLVVEVVSPTDRLKSVQRKALRYVKYGVRLVWVVYPEDKTVEVYRPSKTGAATIDVIDIDGVLDGEDVLPGFKLPVRDIFKVVE
jgi:Uma2 family endonuclease